MEARIDRLKLSENALQTALEYREEAVALRAMRYYNKIVAAKKQNMVMASELHHAESAAL